MCYTLQSFIATNICYTLQSFMATDRRMQRRQIASHSVNEYHHRLIPCRHCASGVAFVELQNHIGAFFLYTYLYIHITCTYYVYILHITFTYYIYIYIFNIHTYTYIHMYTCIHTYTYNIQIIHSY